MQIREYVHTQRANNIVQVTISRPKALNALNMQVLRELDAVFSELSQSDLPACVVITGEGEKSFVAGADIVEMNGVSVDQAAAFARFGQHVMNRIEQFPSPVLAAVNGFALGGGCELALACDVIYAAENAKFGQPEVKLGLIPGFGGCVRLTRKVGPMVAAEWIMTGDVYSAQQAQQAGLVRAIFPSGELLPQVMQIATRIAQRAPLAVRAAKRVMQHAVAVDPVSALQVEQWTFGQLFSSADTREGTAAFVAKREPQFKGC